MPKLKGKTVLLYVLILVVLYLVIAVIPSLTGALTRTETIQEGRLTVEDNVECLLVRDETVYTAAAGGTMKFKAKENSLVKAGATLLTYTKSSQEEEGSDQGSGQYRNLLNRLGKNVTKDEKGKALKKGVFTFFVDGYEGKLTPSSIEKLTKKESERLDANVISVARKATAEGDPIYKIIDNSSWYMVFWVDDKKKDHYEVGKKVQVQFGDGAVLAKVNAVRKDGGNTKVALRTSRTYENFNRIRWADATVVLLDREGLLISNSCIATKDGQEGVYVRTTTDDYEFTPINIIGSDDEQTLVSEEVFYDEDGNAVNTVNVYDEILKHPKKDDGR